MSIGCSVTDAELVARLKANDDEAYREVVARYGDPLYGYIYSITGDHHFSEDVIGETYLHMVEKIDSYTFYGVPFKAWLYRIAHNLAINALKRARRGAGDAALENATATADDPATTIDARLDAEDTFDEAERRLSAGMAREGARKAIESWELREKSIRKAEAVSRRF